MFSVLRPQARTGLGRLVDLFSVLRQARTGLGRLVLRQASHRLSHLWRNTIVRLRQLDLRQANRILSDPWHGTRV